MMKHSQALPAEPDIPGDRRITLEQLRAFAAVARTKSFQAAGIHLDRTQSAITQSMKNLEDYLNCRLLERRQGSVMGLTREGNKILPDVIDVLNKVDMLVQSVQRPEVQRHICFGIPLSFGTAELHDALSHCMAMNKKLKVRLIADTSMHLAVMLENGTLDAAILNEDPASPANGKVTIIHTFLEEPLVWVSHPDALIDWQDEVPFIGFSEGSPWTQAAVKALHDAGIPHYYAYVSTSFESICSAVSEGIGITVLPLSKVPGKYVFAAGNDHLPPLPKVRTVIRARTEDKLVLEFCKLVEQLPVFAQPGDTERVPLPED